jgi:Ankyrin repeats (3 copies)/Sel1 repeat
MLRIARLPMSRGHLAGQFVICMFAAIVYLLDVQTPILKDAPWWRLDLRAERSLDDRSFDVAEKSDTEAAYKDYLTAYPDGFHSTEAKDRIAKIDARIDEAAFREAGQQADRAAAYARYVMDYPNGRHVNEANRLSAKFRDGEDWDIARSENDINSYRGYLKAHRSGRYVDDARTALIEQTMKAIREGAQLIRDNDQGAPPPGYLEADIAGFLKEFPNNSHIAEIRQITAGLADHAYTANSYADAMFWYLKAADLGDAGAENAIGFMYDNGSGVKQDYSDALTWYRRAADHGFAKAQYNVGLDYDAGLGVQRDVDQARTWVQKAASSGDRDAKKWLDERDLYEAAGVGDLPAVASLIAKGVDFNAQTGDGSTALMNAVVHGRKEIVQLLIARRADVRIRTPLGITALSLASQHGYPEIRRMLINAATRR